MMKILVVILIIVVLWYSFGRKWQFMRSCKKNRSENSDPTSKAKSCEQMYKDFTSSSNVNWMPIAFY